MANSSDYFNDIIQVPWARVSTDKPGKLVHFLALYDILIGQWFRGGSTDAESRAWNLITCVVLQVPLISWLASKLLDLSFSEVVWYVLPILLIASLVSNIAHESIVSYDSYDAQTERTRKFFQVHDQYEKKFNEARDALMDYEFTELLARADDQLIRRGLNPISFSILAGREGVKAQLGTPDFRFAGHDSLFWYYKNAKGHIGLNILVAFSQIRPEKGSLALKNVYVLNPDHEKASDIKGAQVAYGLKEKDLIKGLDKAQYLTADTLEKKPEALLKPADTSACLVYDDAPFYRSIKDPSMRNHVRAPYLINGADGRESKGVIVFDITPYQKPDGSIHRLATACHQVIPTSDTQYSAVG